MTKANLPIYIFKQQNQVILTQQNHLVNGHLLYECDHDDQAVIQLVGSSLFVLHNLKLAQLQTIKVTDNEANIVFQHKQLLKLKTLRQTWKKLPKQPVQNLSLPVQNLVLPFLHFNFAGQKITIELPVLTTLSLQTVQLTNLSTFTEDEIVYHRLTLKLNQAKPVPLPADHRFLNKTLKFFVFNDQNGAGLPYWLPRGLLVKNLIRQFVFALEQAAGFIYVETPILGSQSMYETSNHLKHYKDYMFPVLKRKNEALYLRPMTCPHHCLLFASEPRSYASLPLRFSENSLLFRQEASGALLGMERVRQMELKDSHLFLPADDEVIKKELGKCLDLTQTVLKALKIKIREIYLSINDAKPTKFVNLPRLWKTTTALLRTVLEEKQLKYQLKKGEAAFYGPKIDFQIDTALGHNITISTLQLDFVLSNRFGLKYRLKTASEPKYAEPILIHHGLIGTYERLLVILMEQNNGWLPFWLSPVQIVLIPLQASVELINYVRRMHALFQRYQLRSEIASSDSTLAENVRLTWVQKVPIRVFIGAKEYQNNQLTYQLASNRNHKKTLDPLPFIDFCLKMIAHKD